MNLYKETIEILSENGKTLDDVLAVCGGDYQITKDDFVKFSNIEYDSGYGSPEVAIDLVVIGEDFWLERHEYDGSEWWEFKQMPNYKDLPFQKITALTTREARKNGVRCRIGWETLGGMNVFINEEGDWQS